MMRIGQGFDLHRLAPGIPFVLGGIPLDWDKGPQGHSDGDVLLHAVIDALLGATGLGDIGEWFPPTAQHLKGSNSADLLQQVVNRLQAEQWHIVNIDSTILLEQPKLSAYKPKIAENLAQLLNIDVDRIGIKAKTMEGLGDIGSGQAVAAMVSALLEKRP